MSLFKEKQSIDWGSTFPHKQNMLPKGFGTRANFLRLISSNVETAQLAWRLGYSYQASTSIREKERVFGLN